MAHKIFICQDHKDFWKTFSWRSLHHLLLTDPVLFQAVAVSQLSTVWLSSQVQLVPNPACHQGHQDLGHLVQRMQLEHKCSWKELEEKAVSMRCFSKVSSPFQSHLLLLLYSSDTLWQLPRLQSFQVSMSTKAYGGKEQQIRKQRKDIAALSWRTAAVPHYSRGMKCTGFSSTAE